MKRNLISLSVISALAMLPAAAQAEPPPDLVSGFETDLENWRATDPAAVLTWRATDGNPAGHLRATGPGSVWHLASPATWAGDWSGYRTLRFDLALPSGHYPANETAAMVVIAGTNGQTMAWTGPTPLPTWTFYEVALESSAFGVDQATFDGIMAAVSELRVLAEYATGTETVGLDNLVVTATSPTGFTSDLRTTFTSGTTEGWTVVDDANLSVQDEGRPSWALFGNDRQSGIYFKVASPPQWAGDWRNFTEIRYDMEWSNATSTLNRTEMLTLFGANGDVAVWHGTPLRSAWAHHAVPLTAATFGVSEERFQAILRHVSKIWLHGEFNGGDDLSRFDNITVAIGPHTPVIHTASLVSHFDSDLEGWVDFDNATISHDPTGGFLGSGAATVADNGTGTARFQSPDAWSGDWRAFAALRFLVKGGNDFNMSIWIADYRGNILQQSFTPPLRVWTPCTVDLTPAAFGVTQEMFDTVMSDAACLWINSDLGSSTDTSRLDDVSLLLSAAAGPAPPDWSAAFDANAEGWTRGNISNNIWATPAAVHYYYDTAATPPSCIVNTDGGTGTSTFQSPEAWTGDWRGLQSLAFDMQVVQGSPAYLVAPGTMIWLVSAHGSLSAPCAVVPPIGAWRRYEFALNPVAFGVTAAEFDRIVRDVAFLAIRSEWLTGTAEREALDNVLVGTTPTPYWAWLDDFLTPEQLADATLAAPTADPDGDGQSNGAEFLALTSPIDPGSRFFATIRKLPGGGVAVDYPSRSGRVYQVWKSATLKDPWLPVGPLVPGNDLIQTHADAGAEQTAFFRVEV
ncbi:MAG: hypothetical protein MUF04_08300, partial [Akkermansiaceae bacterium]|nr:hypothetical protein [Akkermansiaceae bacterium]